MENFWRGVDLGFKILGIRDQRQKQEMMNRLYESQIASGEFSRMRGEKQFQREEETWGAQQKLKEQMGQVFGQREIPALEGGTIRERDIPPPGGEYSWYAERMLPIMAEHDPKSAMELAKQLQFGQGKEFKPELFMQGEKPVWVTPGQQIPSGAMPREKEGLAPSELRQYEIEMGIDPSMRGTPKYQAGIQQWRKGKQEIRQIVTPVEQGKYAAGLRKEFEDLKPVKDFRDTLGKYSVMREAYKESLITNNYVATDQALITLFNKMTDPTSVVRESEYIRTSHDLSLWNRLKGKVEKVKTGGAGMTQEDRQALLEMGGKFMEQYRSIYEQEVGRFKQYATMSGLPPESVVPNLKIPSLEMPTKISIEEFMKQNLDKDDQWIMNETRKRYSPDEVNAYIQNRRTR